MGTELNEKKGIFMKYAFIVLSFCIASISSALDGTVVSIADGDTLTVLDTSNVEHRIRLAQIDAPEKNQPWGDRSKQSLVIFAAGKKVHVELSGIDQYGRPIGSVFVQNKNAAVHQLKSGMAWVYEQYAIDESLYDIQEAARADKVGLWQDANPVAPWLWRKQRRNQQLDDKSNARR